jgi:hypothetical protein
MNKEETKKAIEVMQAYVDGKEIEYLGDASWGPTRLTGPLWDWATTEYRIKPQEPRVFWLYSGSIYVNGDVADATWRRCGGEKPIKVIEVLES